ncbi:two-partner secretion domain-containing protein [Telluria sp. B2]
MSKHTETSSPALPQLKPLVRSIMSWAQRPSALALALGAMPALALAQMPTGGKVVAGAATITNPDGSHTVIEQSSDKAVLNWQSFSIGQGGHVQFIQRDSNSVALNRVVGSDPSAILGHLSANGQIFLVNQNGIFFGHSAVVDVAGIVATTLDIKDEDFMRGDYRFARGANAPERATVVNQGTLNAGGGYVVLAGDYVANQGLVSAQLGTVLLASGDALTLQMAGSSLINYQVDKATVAHLAGVENSGQILANGGRVIMTAEVAQDLAATVVNNSGLIQARSTVERDGAIYLEGSGGSVANSGGIDASAQAGANGGHVEIRASGDIAHEAGSSIDVSGADSGTSDAGSVMTWADGTNRYKEGAQITARGGAEGGDGGQVELSGNKVLNRSLVDLRAPNGELGTLTLDPTAITIADGAGANAEDQSTIYEQNLEAQLRTGNVNLTAIGQDASITVSSLSDGVLDGSNGGAGGSLSLRASGSGNPTISFANRGNKIKVDGGIAMSTGYGEDIVSGAIDVGQLEAGTRIDLESGSIRAAGLSVARTIGTQSDTSFGIAARAHGGDLAVDGDVNLDITNTSAGALTTSVSLRADNGSVSVGGAVNSNATGLGYYNYNWTTAGNAAPSYYGQQPWTLVSQADHPIVALLDIQAKGSVSAAKVNVLATDKNTVFDTSVGGYWQTANATRHNFWRPTGTEASGSINAGGDVSITGATRVKADGYAVAAYSETESWRNMVNNFNYTSGSQTVLTYTYDREGRSTEHRTVNTYNNLKGSVKGAGGDRYIWQFGPYTVINGATSTYSPNISTYTDSSGGWTTTGMQYSGVKGMSAALDVKATGSVSMNGMEVRSTNRSNTGSGSFTDAFWGHQDTADGLNNTGDKFTSYKAETDYYDSFSTNYTASTSTARANIAAGDNASVNLNGGTSYDVVAEHPLLNAASNSLAGATMSVTAGSAGGATGNGLITIDSGVNVIGAKSADVSLTVRNYDGDVDMADAPAVVTNAYNGHDGRASIRSDNGEVHLESIAVSGGRSAYLDVAATDSLTVDGASSATVTGPDSAGVAAIAFKAGTDIKAGDILASSTHQRLNTVSGYYNYGYDYTVDGGSASIDVQSTDGDIDLGGDVKASGYKTATVNVAASGAGKRLDTADGKTVGATASGNTFVSNSYSRYLSVPTYSASTTLSADSAMDLGSNVEAIVANRNGAANVVLTTTGGAQAAITQDAGTRILAAGSTATVDIDAGAISPNAANAAVASLQGSVAAQGSTGAASVTIDAASGTVHDFGASSTGNIATVTVNTFDAAGTLVVDGTGTIAGNANDALGGSLAINAAGTLDAGAAKIAVRNDSWSANAGARAALSADNGDAALGAISVGAYNTATVFASATGDLLAGGALAANANAGSADINLGTDGKLTVADGSGSAAATSGGYRGTANVRLTGATGVELGGNLTASAQGGAAGVNVNSTGADAQIQQDAGTLILASGAAGNVGVRAGNGDAAFDLQGTLQARGTSDLASVDVSGKSGTVQDFSAVSSAGTASAHINASNGALDLAGSGLASGYRDATLNVIASGDLTAHDSLAATQSGPAGVAQASLASIGGELLLDTGASLTASANGMGGAADATLNAEKGLTLNGDVTAVAMGGNAQANLGTSGGSAAAITQAADTSIRASGNMASVRINAGQAWPDAASGAALALAGTVEARGNAGSASVTINGAGGTVHDVSADSNGSSASVMIGATAAEGKLVLDGSGRATANSDSYGGASFWAAGAGKLDSSAADISVINNHYQGGAQATLNATGGDNVLGNVSVSGASATLNAEAGADLDAGSTLSVNASGAVGRAEAVLTATGTATVAAGATVNATAGNQQGFAHVSIAGDQHLAVEGQLNATASGIGGQANIDLLARSGGIDLDADLSAVAGDLAGINLDAGAGDIALNANLSALGGRQAIVGVRVPDGALAQAADTAIRAGANGGLALVQINSSGAMALDGGIHAIAGDPMGQPGGMALIDVATTGGAGASITQDKDAVIEAAGDSANVILRAGASRPADDIAQAAAFEFAGSVRAAGANGGASVEIAGATGTVHDLQLSATGAPAIAVVSALNGDLALDGTVGITGQADNTFGANLHAQASGSLDTNGATVTVANTGSGASANARVNLRADGGSLKLGQTTVNAEGGSAYLSASAGQGLSVPADLRATARGGEAVVDLSTSGDASATITEDAGVTIAAHGNRGAVSISAGSQKYGGPAAVALGGDVQARGTLGSASITISAAGGSVHDFSAESAGGLASATIEGLAPDAGIVLDGSGRVVANADDSTGAYLTVSSAGALDTSAATLTVANLNGGEMAGASANLYAGRDAVLGEMNVSANATAYLNASAGKDLDVTRSLSATTNALYGSARVSVGAAGNTGIAADSLVNAMAGNGWGSVNVTGDQGVTVDGNLNASGRDASIDVAAASGDVDLNADLTVQASRNAGISGRALGGKLTQAAGKALRSGSTEGAAQVALESQGAMTVDGKVFAAAGAEARIDLVTTGGADAAITQDGASTIEATGRMARVSIAAGNGEPGRSNGNTAAFELDGTIRAAGDTDGAGLLVSGAAGSVHDFTVSATNGQASAAIAAFTGDLALDGAGLVAANGELAGGASLRMQAGGSLDTSGATVAVSSSGANPGAGAEAILVAETGAATIGQTSASAFGGSATLVAAANTALTLPANLSATSTAGDAAVYLVTTGGKDADIVQAAGTTVLASGNQGMIVAAAGNGATDAPTAADLVLGGTLQAEGMFGGAAIDLTAASATVGDFSARSAAGTASVTITGLAADGSVSLNGKGAIGANADSADGARLALSSAGTLDTSAADLVVSNHNGGSSAGATAELVARDGVLGKLGVTGSATASVDARASGKLDVTGALSATAGAGQAEVRLSAGDAASIAANATVDASAFNGAARVDVQGDRGVTVDGEVKASGADAGIGLTAAGGELALDGKLSALASHNANIDLRALDGSLVQAAGSVIKSGATNGVAQVDLASHGAMAINGNIVAAATANGDVDGAHTGAALVGITTTGGAGSSVTQDKASTIEAVGRAARLSVEAGAGDNAADSAAFKLDGSLRAIDAFGGSSLEVAGASGSVHDFTVTASDASAHAVITARNGDLTLDGNGLVIGNAGSAGLQVAASGSLDTRAANLSVTNLDGAASAELLAHHGGSVLGNVSVTGGSAALDASASGKLDVTRALSATAVAGDAQLNLAAGGAAAIAANATVDAAAVNGAAGVHVTGEQGLAVNGKLAATGADAGIDLAATNGKLALDGKLSALASHNANIDLRALDGSLVQAAGSVIKSGATNGVAQVDLASHGAMAINGNIVAAATANGDVDGAHTGAALVGITTTGGAGSSVTQDKASTIEAVGRAARLSVEAGAGDNAADSAAFKLDGTLRAIDMMGGSSLEISGASGSVHDFTVSAGEASAGAVIVARNGDLSLDGNATVIGNADHASGANLLLQASGSLDTTGATVEVGNTGSGDAAGAQATLLAQAGDAKLGPVTVKAQGGGAAALLAQAGNTMTVNGKLGAENLGLGIAAGSASITLKTTGKGAAAGTTTSTITQEAGATIGAASFGNAGDATIDIQAGNCCNSEVVLNDTVKSVVTGGTGNAAIAVRGNAVTAKDVTANVVAGGSGNALASLAAPTELKLDGTIDAQAGSGARADVKLISDQLTDNATFKLSSGNGHVQLSSFDTRRIIGVHSDKDFDATSDTNYVMSTLKKFVTQGAELSFGGEFDRSAWTNGSPADTCVPGMDGWASQLQHTGEIHVAGNGRLNLGDVKMVFDTTGNTIYHDPKMSAWSVPTGRVATLIVPPSNVDRYLDRTDNTLQNMNKVVQDTSTGARPAALGGEGGPAVRGTQITGKLFMDGNGVNMVRNDAADGSQAAAQGSENDRRNRDGVTEE